MQAFRLSGRPGAEDHFVADREAAERALETTRTWSSRCAPTAFPARAVRYLVAEGGIRQFPDIGTGIPTASNTHQVAQQAAPDCRIVYVDNDPIVLSHARALLTSTPEGACAYVDADLRDPPIRSWPPPGPWTSPARSRSCCCRCCTWCPTTLRPARS